MLQPRNARHSPFPAGLVGMLALVAAVEYSLARHDFSVLSLTQWDGRASRQAAEKEAKGCDVLIFGDSLVKLGVLPRVIEERSGLRSYSLAVAGSQPLASYFLLRRALNEGARPSAVV